MKLSDMNETVFKALEPDVQTALIEAQSSNDTIVIVIVVAFALVLILM